MALHWKGIGWVFFHLVLGHKHQVYKVLKECLMGHFCVNRPLKNSDISLMDDNLNEWGEEETLDTKHFKVSRATLHISL